MKPTSLSRIIALLLPVLLFASCNNDYEEYYFKGVVKSVDMCSASSVSYLIEVAQPTTIGDSITVDGVHLKNAVMAFRSPERMKIDDTIYGVAYNTHDFAALNCAVLYFTSLPEIVLMSVDEDPSVIEGKSYHTTNNTPKNLTRTE